jgi:hypothetical protein
VADDGQQPEAIGESVNVSLVSDQITQHLQHARILTEVTIVARQADSVWTECVHRATVLTVVGWSLVINSLIRFCAPKLALRIVARVSFERSWEFQVSGAGLVALTRLLVYDVCQ